MDKGSRLLLGLYKIWVCSPQFAYIYYTHFILYKTSFKKSAMGWSAICEFGIYWSYSITFRNLLGSFFIHIAVFRFLPMVHNDKHAIYIMI